MSKTNLYASLLVGLIAISYIVYDFVDSGFVFNFYIIHLIILFIIAEFIASTTALNIENLLYIRSKEESLKKALPIVPFKIKKVFLLIPVNVIILLITGFTAHYFLHEPLSSYWLVILFLPLLTHLFFLLKYFIFKETAFIDSQKKIFEDEDRHDSLVKIAKKLANKDSKSCRKTNTSQYQTVLNYLNSGQNPDEVFENRYTLLIPSACCGDYKLAKLLVERGSNINFKSSLGTCSLHLASKHGFYDIVKLLIDNGADINIKDGDGKTALMYAQENGFIEIINILNNSKKHK